jgi:hypothetical protein
MTTPRVFVLCPDYDKPSGGVRRLYRHVDVLRKGGIEAWLLHQKPGFRCSWFASTTPIAAIGQMAVTSSDYLLLPEIYGSGLTRLAPGVPKVIFNQNAYLTFQAMQAGGPGVSIPYLHPEVIAVFAVSEDNAEYLRYAFPGLIVQRLHYGIDPLFSPRWPKRRVLAYMPRKNAGDAVQVLAMLHNRGSLDGWEIEPIDGLPEPEVARRLAESAVFLSFGTVEGCPLPPLEAMASGCVAIGYHGRGGREYFDPAFSYPIEAGDVLGFARAVEEALRREQLCPGFLEKQGRLAAEFVRAHYSPEREEQDILDLWRSIMQGARRLLPAE